MDRSPLSSTIYCACLTPDTWLRIVVLSSGRVLIAAGTVFILILDQHPIARGIACIAWLSYGRFRLLQIGTGFDACLAIRVYPEGAASVLSSDSVWVSAHLLPGSIMLQKLGWLRLRTDAGLLIQELVRRDGRGDLDWRRLQVIWRHIGAVL